MTPLTWNSLGKQAAAFVASSFNNERRYLFDSCQAALQIDGYGRAFNSNILNHNRSFFTKRQLLADYQFSFCPENSLYPGYYTEKIPEAFACGTIPIGYADHHVYQDFNEGSFINLVEYLPYGISHSLAEVLASLTSEISFLSTPLISSPIKICELQYFLQKVVEASLA